MHWFADVVGCQPHEVRAMLELYIQETQGEGHPEGLASWLMAPDRHVLFVSDSGNN